MIYQTRLRCIGGNSDGVLMPTENHYRINDYIRVPTRYECKIEDWVNKTLPEVMTQPYNIYRIAVFNFKKEDQYYFLVPENWTDKEAILFQFSK